MKLWIKLQHWFYRMLIDYKTKKIVEFNKERENHLKNKTMKFWIARDLTGNVWAYRNKPIFNEETNEFESDTADLEHLDFMYLGVDVLPELTFENSPQQVEINLIK